MDSCVNADVVVLGKKLSWDMRPGLNIAHPRREAVLPLYIIYAELHS